MASSTEMHTKSKSKLPVIAAIDIGTANSGYAFGMRAELQNSPLSIHCNQTWNSGNYLSLKTPTCLLLNEHGQFQAFGYEAQEQYAVLLQAKKHQQYFYFKNFKMRLGGYSEFRKDMLMDDENGRAFLAISVFALSIQYFKEHFLYALRSHNTGMTANDVQWVLTVPAIWSHHAKQFMREAAIQAGIEGKRLRLALEPEAASVYCVTSGVLVRDVGTIYMVVDIGGGTADITVHRIENGGRLAEVYRASGGAWGGMAVDFEFEKQMRKIIGTDVLRDFSDEHKLDYIHMMRSFELAKRSVDASKQKDVQVLVPTSLVEFCKSRGKTLEKAISDIGNTGIRLSRDRIAFGFSVMNKMMQPAIKPILGRIREILQSIPNVTDILLVGGFSESSLVSKAVREEFGQVDVRVAIDPGISVLKGAVLFGFAPSTIISRVTRFTYGMHRSEPFQEGKHNPEFKVEMDGTQRCQNIFQILVTKDMSIPVDHVIKRRSKTLYEGQKSIPYKMYVSKSKTPTYVKDDGCSLIGSEIVEIDQPGKATRWFHDSYMFGDTEIRLQVECEKTGKKWNFTFQLPQ
ncbi:hypothetical protein ScPMuIL_000440 [Solemya velum]